MTQITLQEIVALGAVFVLASSIGGIVWAALNRQTPFVVLFSGLSVIALIAVLVIGWQIEDRRHCEERTVAGLMKHSTFITIEERSR